MIILLGPDHSGKTTLMRQLGAYEPETGKQWHAVAETDYDDYMELLSGPKSRPIPLGQYQFTAGQLLQANTHYVLDRWFWCEAPYAEIVRKIPMKFNLKQFHNLHLATIAHNPVVILTTHKAPNYNDPTVPEELFPGILNSYREWLTSLGVEYIEWDYTNPPMSLEALIDHSWKRQTNVIWWRNLAKRGIAGWGNTVNPRVMVLAEVLGGYNVYHLPFESGPSGFYLSELIDEHSIPLSDFYITNWKKVNDKQENKDLLLKEIQKTGITTAIILGSVARNEAGPVFREAGITDDHIFTIRHPGWVVNHSENVKEMEFRKKAYSKEWGEIWKKALGDIEMSRSDLEFPLEEFDLIKVI